MIPIITDDGIRLLPIIYSFPAFVLVAEHHTIYSIQRNAMVCGLVDVKDVHLRTVKLETYAVKIA
jgi:hypothetical protein